MRSLADEATQGPWRVWYDPDPTKLRDAAVETAWCHGDIEGDTELITDYLPTDADAEFIAACREWVPDALRRLDNARVIARKLLEASGAYSTLDATPEFPEAYQLAQDLYEALDKLEHLDAPNGDDR